MKHSQTLILGSSSMYRRELLERLRIPFLVARPDINETPLPNETPVQTALRLALQKTQHLASQFSDALIIGSDQVATVDGVQIGKAGSHERALVQLKMMRGKAVEFHSALCLLDAKTGTYQQDNVITRAHFASLSDEELSAYLHIEQPYDCAGSAKVEGLGITLLEKVESDDPTALVGLPLISLSRMLRQAGVPLYQSSYQASDPLHTKESS